MDLGAEMLLPIEFDECVRRAVAWVREQESNAERDGAALDAREREIARAAGVRDIERVRVVRASPLPSPGDPVLVSAMQATDFWVGDGDGLALGHAIFLRREAGHDAEILAHELVHVAQSERLGLEGFLRAYLGQCLEVGYDHAPLELEARAFRIGGAST